MLRKLKTDVVSSKWMLGIIAGFGALFAMIGANSGCCLFLHQPEKPDLSKLRKF